MTNATKQANPSYNSPHANFLNEGKTWGGNPAWEGESFPDRYGAWDSAPNGTHFTHDYLVYSDYSGQLVERSNVAEFRECFAEQEDLAFNVVHGGHGTVAIVMKADALTEDMIDFLNALDNYPLANEDRHSHMEIEAQNAAWENSYCKEFRKALDVETMEERTEYIDGLSDSDLYLLFNQGAEEANVYWANEQGDEMYIDVDRIVNALMRVNPELIVE